MHLYVPDVVQGFAWEPHGNKFAIIHEPQAAHGVSVSFYEMGAEKVRDACSDLVASSADSSVTCSAGPEFMRWLYNHFIVSFFGVMNLSSVAASNIAWLVGRSVKPFYLTLA